MYNSIKKNTLLRNKSNRNIKCILGNYKTLLKETKENQTAYVFMDWKINTVTMIMLPKLICRFSAIPTKISVAFFAEIDKQILKFT